LFRSYQLTIFFSPRALIHHNTIGYFNTFTPTVRSFVYSHLYRNHSFLINLSFYAIFFPRVTENLRLIPSETIPSYQQSNHLQKDYSIPLYSRNIFSRNLAGSVPRDLARLDQLDFAL